MFIHNKTRETADNHNNNKIICINNNRTNQACGLTHLSNHFLSWANTNARWRTVSKFPRGIWIRVGVRTEDMLKFLNRHLKNSQCVKPTCRITLVSWGTTVTILDPLSTRRSVSSFWPPSEASATCSPGGSKVIWKPEATPTSPLI